MNLQLCWLRNDLRLYDNPALEQALTQGACVALYIASPAQWAEHDEAAIKQDFWRRNLESLQLALAAKQVPLVICRIEHWKDIPNLFGELIEKWGISTLHYNREYAINERRRDEAVTGLCRNRGVEVSAWQDQVLLSPTSLFNQSGQPFKVFTPFARRAREYISNSDLSCSIRAKVLANSHLPELPEVSTQCELSQAGWPEAELRWRDMWPAGEAHAASRLTGFCRNGIAHYHKSRDFPAVAATSSLSPYLASGVLSIRECWRQSGAYCDGEGVETWRNELLWRDFYRHIMYHYPHVCKYRSWKIDLDAIAWRHDEVDFQRWCQGMTGIPIIDAAMRQLLERGWMHNRLRMVVAMFLSKHLLLDWRWGERWFMRHLIDGDFASNNGGWQWSASTGTDAAPYFRIFNPVTQSRRFDPDGTFIRQYLPELAGLDNKSIHEPKLLRPDCYPEPMIDLKFGRERALEAFRQG